jgi:hypothetical protein
VKNISTGRIAKMTINARRLYLPTVFVVALIVAAPIAWRRKPVALSLGLILISIYVGFGVWLKLVHAMSEPQFGALTIGPSLRKLIMVLIVILTKSPVAPYIVALLVFVLVTLRREDIVRLGMPAIRRPRGVSAAIKA